MMDDQCWIIDHPRPPTARLQLACQRVSLTTTDSPLFPRPSLPCRMPSLPFSVVAPWCLPPCLHSVTELAVAVPSLT